MRKGKIFNKEKILYFANERQGLHVSIYEEEGTDLSTLVSDALQKGYIVRAAEDDSGLYYVTTDAGKIRLLELQIEWRRSRGKKTAAHESRLAKLKDKRDDG